MLRTSARLLPTLSARARAMSTEVPVNQVARVARLHVGNEENALKADAIVKSLLPEMEKQPGYLKTKRTVCKAEWAYEVDVVFKDFDSFKGYMESDFRTGPATAAFEKIVALKPADAPEVYMGARVYDEL